MSEGRKALTIRLPADLYAAGVKAARRRQLSMNRFVQESLKAALEAEEDRRLYAAFAQVGADTDSADVEFALEAEAEVVARGES